MSENILDKIVATKRREIAIATQRRSLPEVKAAIKDASPVRDFLAALKGSPPIRLIAEVKKASPSKGVIREDFEPVAIAKKYEAGGASCLSVLTDVSYFQGALEYLTAVAKEVSIPVLRKDFLIEPYQIYEARAAGADAVLLIAECLPPDRLRELYDLACELGMRALIELYDPSNISMVVATGTPLIGVNNRDLQTFIVDLNHTINVRQQIPADRILVGESGIADRSDAELLEKSGVNAMLVGESLMRQPDIEQAVKKLLGTASE